jgi:hypothetical protein
MKRGVTLLVIAAVTASVIGLAATGSAGGAESGAAAGALGPPIPASTTTPTGSSIVIAMGHLRDPSNTFWEVFLRQAGRASWVLHTPPGVASNGGLMLAASPSGSLTVGFLVSADLKFSPVAQSSDGGLQWSPGVLPYPLTSTPDALAVGPAGEALTLAATGDERVLDQRVLETSGDLSDWRTLTTGPVLARADPACGAQAMTAVAYGPGAQPLLGLRCSRSGSVGILVAAAGTSDWHDIGLSLPSGSGVTAVTRLVSSTDGVAGVAQLQSGPRASVVGFWGNGSTAKWARTATLAVPAGWSVRATATGGGSGQGLAVLLGSGDKRRVVVVTGPGASWVTLPLAPMGTSGVSYLGAEVDTFVVAGSHLAVWGSSARAAGWRRSATINVPVPYGSSS